VEAIPVLNQEREITGFILALQNISPEIEKYDAIDTLLSRFEATLTRITNRADRVRIQDQYRETAKKIRDLALSRLPLATLDLKSFLSNLQKTVGYELDIRLNLFNIPPDLRLKADTYSLSQALVFLFDTLSAMTWETEFNITVDSQPPAICFDISWENRACTLEEIHQILNRKARGLARFSHVLKFNHARVLPVDTGSGQCCQVQIFVMAAKESVPPVRQRPAVMAGSRPEYYDFDLFNMDESVENMMDTSLRKLTYTVFDTETTGLNPDAGDEIISIGAVRIVNNRIVYQDVFEELVNPGREIPMESYRIHGIHYEMVMEKDPIEKVLPAFKRFTANTVLLGHNIAFDMKMLKVKEKSTGIHFHQPVLDTLLLSAALHPVHEHHDLENIARRLGVRIIGRHTALGDAVTTAQIFLKLVPILNSNGILTLKDAVTASKRTYYARLKY
jgi:DNA polymerase-3 subunit epsilon